MNISRNSLPYRFIQFVLKRPYWNMPKSLCSFFWTLVWAVFVGIVKLLVISLAVSFIFILAIVAPGVTIYDLFIGNGITERGEIGFGILASYVLIIITIALIWFQDYCKEKYRVKRQNKSDEYNQQPSEPSILVEYIKAKKAKVCPMIEYVE